MGVKAHLPRSSLFLASLLGCASCMTSSQVADFARNDLFYVDVPFHTKAPGDVPVFVAPLVDARGAAVLPTHDHGFPISYSGDEFWERPVAEMMGDVLVRQLAASQLFPAVVDQPTPQGLVVKPSLVTFVGGSTEAISGSRTFAEVGLRVQVFGPAGSDGKRPVLHEQTYGNRQMSPLELNPVSPYRLFGRAMQATMAKLLAGLDGSNVARSGVPIDVAVPAEASAPTR